MSSALYYMVMGIFLFCSETDGSNITWYEPLPVQTVQDSDQNYVHLNHTQLLEGTINAFLTWQFKLSADLIFDSLVLKFGNTRIAGVRSSGQGALPGFQEKFGISWIPSERITLIVFNVTVEENGTFACEISSGKQADTLNWYSNIKVNVVAPPSKIVTSGNQTVEAPKELTLSCSADGKPKVNITWIRLSDNTMVENLMPFQVTGKKEAGQYRCIADNGVGTPLTSDVFITVLFAPVVTLASKFYVGREQNASLICIVEGNPTPSIEWRPCDWQNMECEKQQLNISKVQTSRTNYTCAANNSLGNVSQTTVLIIGGKSVFLRISTMEDCGKENDVWTKLQSKMAEAFKNTGTNYADIELIAVRCGSLIFDLELKFNTEVAEDSIISTLKRAVSGGEFGDLRINASSIIGIPPAVKTTSTPSTKTTPTSKSDNTLIIVGAVLGAVALVVIIAVIVWCVRKKKCPNETKEVSDGNASGQGRGGGAQGQNGGDESAYDSAYSNASVLPPSKKPANSGKEDSGQAIALPVYAEVDKSKKKPRSEREAKRQPGELLYVQADHSNEGSLPTNASGNPSRPPPYQDTVYADLV